MLYFAEIPFLIFYRNSLSIHNLKRNQKYKSLFIRKIIIRVNEIILSVLTDFEKPVFFKDFNVLPIDVNNIIDTKVFDHS